MAMERSPGQLFLGETIDDAGKRTGTPVLLNSADLTTHGVIVGMTGSGKTGLGIVLIEEARLAGIPVLAFDPKGDLGNLCLTFPSLDAAAFEPWIDQGTARVQGTTVGDLWHACDQAGERVFQEWAAGARALGFHDVLDSHSSGKGGGDYNLPHGAPSFILSVRKTSRKIR